MPTETTAKGYHFKLEALRKFRCHEEERFQKALSDALRQVGLVQLEIDEKNSLREKTELEFQQCQGTLTTGPQAAMYRLFLTQLSIQQAVLENELHAQKQQLETTRLELLEAMKKRKAIDKIKEKEINIYIDEINRKEEKFIDEIAINRFILNRQ